MKQKYYKVVYRDKDNNLVSVWPLIFCNVGFGISCPVIKYHTNTWSVKHEGENGLFVFTNLNSAKKFRKSKYLVSYANSLELWEVEVSSPEVSNPNITDVKLFSKVRLLKKVN